MSKIAKNMGITQIPDMYYLSTCHGPAGSSIVFKLLYEITGDNLIWFRQIEGFTGYIDGNNKNLFIHSRKKSLHFFFCHISLGTNTRACA